MSPQETKLGSVTYNGRLIDIYIVYIDEPHYVFKQIVLRTLNPVAELWGDVYVGKREFTVGDDAVYVNGEPGINYRVMELAIAAQSQYLSNLEKAVDYADRDCAFKYGEGQALIREFKRLQLMEAALRQG
jgi:hypothetical protein